MAWLASNVLHVSQCCSRFHPERSGRVVTNKAPACTTNGACLGSPAGRMLGSRAQNGPSSSSASARPPPTQPVMAIAHSNSSAICGEQNWGILVHAADSMQHASMFSIKIMATEIWLFHRLCPLSAGWLPRKAFKAMAAPRSHMQDMDASHEGSIISTIYGIYVCPLNE